MGIDRTHYLAKLEDPGVTSRLAVDVTHYNRDCYLTCVDCGPSRFVIWKKLRDESATSIVAELETILRERGPPAEILMDNGLGFRSAIMKTLLDRWQIQGIYRCTYRPSGNGVVERNHRQLNVWHLDLTTM